MNSKIAYSCPNAQDGQCVEDPLEVKMFLQRLNILCGKLKMVRLQGLSSLVTQCGVYV